jgi:hypothetical protein
VRRFIKVARRYKLAGAVESVLPSIKTAQTLDAQTVKAVHGST